MRAIGIFLFGIGFLLVAGVGVTIGLRHMPEGGPMALFQDDTAPALATTVAPDMPVAARAVRAPRAPEPLDLPASFTEITREDLRPAAPASLDYTPQVREVTTYRMIDGLRLRRAAVYDGGTGPTARPVVILFHGASRDELSMIDMWDDTADAHGLILISLKSDGGTWDPNTDDTDLLARALDAAGADFPIDRNRMFLFGHSAGSIYAQLLANRADGPWIAVAGHAGTLPAHWILPRNDAPPIRHYLGSSDGIFAPHDARQSAENLAQMGHFSELILIPGHTHWFYEGGPAIAEDAWRWFADVMGEPAG